MTAAIEIRETVVTPTADGLSVALHISDAPKNDETATLTVAILVTLPKPKLGVLALTQRAAIQEALKVLTDLHSRLYDEVPSTARGVLNLHFQSDVVS